MASAGVHHHGQEEDKLKVEELLFSKGSFWGNLILVAYFDCHFEWGLKFLLK